MQIIMTERYEDEDGVPISISAEVAETRTGQITDNGDGTYAVNYTAILDGTFRLDVMLNGQHILDGPFVVILDMAQPPEMLSSVFAESGGAIFVAFDQDTDKVSRHGLTAAAPMDNPCCSCKLTPGHRHTRPAW